MYATHRVVACSLLFLTAGLSAPALAQVKAFSGTVDRKCTQVAYFTESFESKGFVSIDYGTPEWQQAHAELIQKAGTRHRLGKDGWTTLDTSVSLDFGATKVLPGTYYLAIEVPKKGECNLVLLDANKIRANKISPHQSSETKGGTFVGLKNVVPADDESVQKLRITLTPDEKDNSKVTLELRWGNLMLTAKLTAKIDAA